MGKRKISPNFDREMMFKRRMTAEDNIKVNPKDLVSEISRWNEVASDRL
jgi:hypothetical protein